MTSNRSQTALKSLRNVMKNTAYVPQGLQAYIITSCDAHQSEYVAACDKRRQFVSGFTGSAGTAIVTEKNAALWTDGRYFLQAQEELSSEWILMKIGLQDTPSESEWLLSVLPSESCVGIDPYLVSHNKWSKWSSKLEAGGHRLVSVNQNLVDLIWNDRPPQPNGPVEILPFEFTGATWESKVKDAREEMRKNNVSFLIITALDEIAWLFNLRGSDIDYNPVFFAYAVVTLVEIHLFVDEKKLSDVIKKELQGSNGLKVLLHPYNDILQFVSSLDGTKITWISKSSNYALVSLIPKDNLYCKPNPVCLGKAVKNDQEIKCMRNAHIKDAVAICEFLDWLENALPQEEITEISAAEKLEDFRKMQKHYVGPSFETISASGTNGAIVHYKPKPDTNKRLLTSELYLCDSGAQYRDGTTDVTRTCHFGVPTAYEKECYTRVLKGHIFVSSALFPRLIKGQMLDTLARKSLWDVGLDYLHGTGHGVGMYLNVHEGPMGISYKAHPSDPGLKEGMILSIEPGFYDEGKFGIRLENLALITSAEPKFNFQDITFLTFEPLTLVPFQKKMLEPSLLTAEEINWINDYHSTCRRVVGKALEEQEKTSALRWLMKETVPIG